MLYDSLFLMGLSQATILHPAILLLLPSGVMQVTLFMHMQVTLFMHMQVTEASPLAAVKCMLTLLDITHPNSLTGSRALTSAHEWFGLHCYSDPTIRRCIELLPNALDILGASGLLRHFPVGRRRPAQGVHQKPWDPLDKESISWPAWYQQLLDAGSLAGKLCEFLHRHC